MIFKLNHVHLRAPDPQTTAQFYVDCLGATVVARFDHGGLRLDLHGLPLNITTSLDGGEDHGPYGIEHIGIDTDDLPGTVRKLREAGARVLEERTLVGGRKMYFMEGPEAVCLELSEIRQ